MYAGGNLRSSSSATAAGGAAALGLGWIGSRMCMGSLVLSRSYRLGYFVIGLVGTVADFVMPVFGSFDSKLCLCPARDTLLWRQHACRQYGRLQQQPGARAVAGLSTTASGGGSG
jgi:hypothetical protein